ncbi:MAG: rod shape-determining protein RodA [Rikenellaceae bacterium]
MQRQNSGSSTIDWSVVFIYLAMVTMGWINIYASLYDDTNLSIFDLSLRSGMQFIWIAFSVALATVIMLLDCKYFHIFAYPIYTILLLVLISVLFMGREINGAKSWLILGPIALQPAEFMKFATALVVARYMSSYGFDIKSLKSLLGLGVIFILPMGIILLQNDTGSALVYFAFAAVLYREGISGWWYVVGVLLIATFVLSFVLQPIVLIILLILACTICEGVLSRSWNMNTRYLAALAMSSIIIYVGCSMMRLDPAPENILATVTLLSLPLVGVYAYKINRPVILLFIAFFVVAYGVVLASDYVFDNMLQVHQQKRILNLLGLESDPRGWGYNVNQSKIAIGSGGLLGKGFLQGTQTKFNFVPEQSTDFIFCTVGEEWGFIGSLVVLALFAVLIIKLMIMGERQREPFGRIYCYSVAAIFSMHVLINIGMTIGLLPVIGIPLPFFSYGGSSMISFTVLLFVALRLDAAKLGHD